ncbi:MAG: NifU N-terminal domain-containing protein [Acidimicrobiales bacterium]|nr:NifU N-terminal domain-containing protein [Acidimicrobiales bacterium]
MGQPVTLIKTSSPRPGILRFELNRSLTGMGHVRYEQGDEIIADDPASELAGRLFEAGGVVAVHVYSSVVTVTLASTDVGDLETVIGGLYTYYLPGVEIPSDEELIAMVDG